MTFSHISSPCPISPPSQTLYLYSLFPFPPPSPLVSLRWTSSSCRRWRSDSWPSSTERLRLWQMKLSATLWGATMRQVTSCLLYSLCKGSESSAGIFWVGALRLLGMRWYLIPWNCNRIWTLPQHDIWVLQEQVVGLKLRTFDRLSLGLQYFTHQFNTYCDLFW